MPEESSKSSGSWLGGIPIKTARWRIALLGLIFRNRWWIQVGPRIYVLREPDDILRGPVSDDAIRLDRDRWTSNQDLTGGLPDQGGLVAGSPEVGGPPLDSFQDSESA